MAEEFLSRLNKCKVSGDMTDKELLAVDPYALIEDADIRYKANSRKFRNWRDFEKSF